MSGSRFSPDPGYIQAQLLHFATGVLQAFQRGRKLGLGLGDLVHQFGFALFKVQDCLIADFLGVVHGLGQQVHLGEIAAGHAGKAVQQPIGEPSQGKGQKQNDGGGDGQLGAVHGICLVFGWGAVKGRAKAGVTLSGGLAV